MANTLAVDERRSPLPRIGVAVGVVLVLAILIWQAVTTGGSPDPTAPQTTRPVATLDIAVLVFREGLECILVLSAITVGMRGKATQYRSPIAWGAFVAALASIATWFIAVRAIDALTDNVSALALQAATGLLAILVLLLVMNWFFHRIYWSGWIGMHNRRKRELLDLSADADASRRKIFLGLAALGFTSLYREGFEIVLFLQSYRLRLGGSVVLAGVLIGTALAAIVAVLTFIARRHLPYKQMLVFTGALLGVVLLVMVGEQGQEMQLAHWIPTTTIPFLANRIPAWAGVWLSVFPTVETLLFQTVAAVLVIGSYIVARVRTMRAAEAA
jgi:high-affinity iron transporter